MHEDMQRAMKVVLGFIAALVALVLVLAVAAPLLGLDTDTVPVLRTVASRAPTARVFGADGLIGLLLMAFVARWWVQATSEPDPDAPPLRARKPSPNPGSLNPITDLLGGPPVEQGGAPPDHDPEAGGDHVYRWTPDDEDGRP